MNPSLWWWLAGCGETPLPVTTVQGLQVVAITATPAQPTGLQTVELEVWVADGLGLGAEVLLWMCSPVDGRCLEFEALPGSVGLPLQFVTEVGTADPVFRATVNWPFLAGIATDYLDPEVVGGLIDGDDTDVTVPGLLVWAVACVPGVCDVIRQVRADPIAAGPTWVEATAALSNPAKILEGLEPGEASVAVKFLPLWTTPFGTGTFYFPNSAPLVEADPSDLPPADRVVNWLDPDGDDVQFQVFTTGGTVELGAGTNPNQVTIRHEPDRFGWGDVFLVAEDGRGGSAVWSSTRSERAQCEPVVRLPQGPRAGDLYALSRGAQVLDVQVRGFTPGSQIKATVLGPETGTLYAGNATVPELITTTPYGGYGGLAGGSGASTEPEVEVDPCLFQDLTLVVAPQVPIDPCTLGGLPLTVQVKATDFAGSTAETEVLVIARSLEFCP